MGVSFGGLAVADVNGDGKPDVLGLVVEGQVVVFVSNGDATVKPGVAHPADQTPTSY